MTAAVRTTPAAHPGPQCGPGAPSAPVDRTPVIHKEVET